jgi:hypothetical protein
MTYLDRDEVGRKIIETSQEVSAGYRRNIQDGAFSSNEKHDACAIAASNTGYWILQSLGFDQSEIAELIENRGQRRSARDDRDLEHG